MSDTPRTDAETMRDEYDHVDTEFGAFAPSNTVSADFARQLERELAEVTKQRDELVEALDNCLGGYDVPSEIAVMTQEDYAFAKSALSAAKGGQP